jgi:hypothetical protein
MTRRVRPFRKTSVAEGLVFRDRLGFGRYRKTAARDPEEREILLALALRKIEKAERRNFIPLGPRRRRVKI